MAATRSAIVDDPGKGFKRHVPPRPLRNLSHAKGLLGLLRRL